MIHVIEKLPYLEKTVRGNLNEDKEFFSEFVTYRLNNTAISLSRYLEKMRLEFQTYGVVGNQTYEYTNDIKNFFPIQMNIQNEMRIQLMVEEEKHYEYTEEIPILEKWEERLFSSIVCDRIHNDDISVVIEDEYHNNSRSVYELHSEIKAKSSLMIGCVHPKYLKAYPKQFFSVLVIDYANIVNSFHMKQHKSLFEIGNFVREELSSLARIVVLNVSSHQLVVSLNGKLYAATYMVKDPIHGHYLDAILAGIIKCYSEDGDIYVLLNEALSRSVGASLSSGLYVPTDKILMDIKTKIKILSLEDS
ncbi:hypothetical protein [Breznakia pachnodae]|uniref:Uncharacterized protein n=1 Tax=Breznakia pachnodae TaxID=265178 RepID=A0ABU0E2Y1_9FIRM|nr:hypothetical protein [Breznakia pachnodae]MDQ0361242.1 hypothetical protein [Breznakia pachnodae]